MAASDDTGQGAHPIPNLGIGHLAGGEHADADVHYAELDTLATRLGRSMSVHRHDRYFQVHYVASGAVRVHMDDSLYRLDGPMFFLTPPAFAHAFVTADNAAGHVLTVRQPIIASLLAEDPALANGKPVAPICLAVDRLSQDYRDDMRHLALQFDQLRTEFHGDRPGREQALRLWARLIFVSLLRLAPASLPAPATRKDELALFRGFNALLEENFLQHWPVSRYCAALGISEQRLNEACRHVASQSPKRLVQERLMQEAKRLLVFSSHSVADVADLLGFKDPAYFSRFFQRLAGQPPGLFRSDARHR